MNTEVRTRRPRPCRSEFQPNLLEYIDSTLTDTLTSQLTLTRTSSEDPFGNTILDQYLLYLLCQKIDSNDFYRLLHQLIVCDHQISKGFFQYSPPRNAQRPTYDATFSSYTNFIWNELNVTVLLDLASFLLKYRLNAIFLPSIDQEKMFSFFMEILIIAYLSANHQEDFLRSRSTSEMIFPSPSVDRFSILRFPNDLRREQTSLKKFLQALDDNGEIRFDLRRIKSRLQSESFQYLTKKLENKKIDLIRFFESVIKRQSCRSLKSICRQKIKLTIKNYPNDIEQLRNVSRMSSSLRFYLLYENPFIVYEQIQH